MPTPNDDVPRPLPAALSSHASCPPEVLRSDSSIEGPEHTYDVLVRPRDSSPVDVDEEAHRDQFASAELNRSAQNAEHEAVSSHNRMETTGQGEQTSHEPSVSRKVRQSNTKDGEAALTSVTAPEAPNSTAIQTTLTGSGFPRARLQPSSCSSFLRSGSRFVGTQSGKALCQVEVTIKHVDMNEYFICGYFRIEGLVKTEKYLTTYFEGEIIGPKYTFRTKHESWGATEKQDMQYWERFPQWRPLANAAKKPDFTYKNCMQRENMFMRWKEYFVVPDHRNKSLPGASFDGFYYICFNQVEGTISGVYASDSAEKYQQLELKHVNDGGCFGAVEFR